MLQIGKEIARIWGEKMAGGKKATRERWASCYFTSPSPMLFKLLFWCKSLQLGRKRYTVLTAQTALGTLKIFLLDGCLTVLLYRFLFKLEKLITRFANTQNLPSFSFAITCIILNIHQFEALSLHCSLHHIIILHHNWQFCLKSIRSVAVFVHLVNCLLSVMRLHTEFSVQMMWIVLWMKQAISRGRRNNIAKRLWNIFQLVWHRWYKWCRIYYIWSCILIHLKVFKHYFHYRNEQLHYVNAHTAKCT